MGMVQGLCAGAMELHVVSSPARRPQRTVGRWRGNPATARPEGLICINVDRATQRH